MGYTIRIGQRVPKPHDKYCTDAESCSTFGEPFCYETVSDAELDEAPAFGDWSDHKNWRMPSYVQWHDFCREAGEDVRHLWYGDEGHADNGQYQRGGLLVEHPGIVTLTEDHYKVVHAALERWQAARPGAVPGFDDDKPIPGTRILAMSDGCSGNGKDAILARLLWMDWWMRWALDNCEWPSVYNS